MQCVYDSSGKLSTVKNLCQGVEKVSNLSVVYQVLQYFCYSTISSSIVGAIYFGFAANAGISF